MMLTLIFAMTAVLATWAVIGCALTGIGLLVRRCLGARDIDAGELLLAFWLGFACVMVLLQLWNFALPVSALSESIVVALGAIGLFITRNELSTWLNETLPARRKLLILLALVACWLANRSIGPGNADDSGLYHYTAILWARSFPIVTGVGNLSAPQAMNNASFLYTALLDHGLWRGRAEHVANGLLLLAMWTQVLRGCWLLLQRRGWLIENLYNAAMLPAAFMLAIAKDVSSPKTDLPAGAISVAIGWWFLRLVLHPDAREWRSDRLLSLAMLCAVAICAKISTGALAGTAGVIALVVWLRAARASQQHVVGTLVGCVLVVGLLLGPWIGRNIIMSGYPLYPSRVLAMNVAWRVPEPARQYLEDSICKQNKGGMTIWIHGVAEKNRLLKWYAPLIKPPFETRDEVAGFNWVRTWLLALPLTSPVEIVLPVMLALLGGASLVMRRGKHGRELVVLALPPAAGLLFWVFAGPDPRYGWPAAWMLAAFTLALAFGQNRHSLIGRPRWMFFALLIAMIVPVFAYRLGVQVFLGRDRPLHEVFLLGPGPDHGFHPRPTSPMTTITNRWGVTINVPTGDFPYHCWNGPLPCSGWPALDPDLRLRREGDLAGGFVINHSRTK